MLCLHPRCVKDQTVHKQQMLTKQPVKIINIHIILVHRIKHIIQFKMKSLSLRLNMIIVTYDHTHFISPVFSAINKGNAHDRSTYKGMAMDQNVFTLSRQNCKGSAFLKEILVTISKKIL